MAKAFTENSFSSTYKDDFIDSDNYHRILFNSGRALQARELIQMQTIIQEEVARFGRNIFKDGALLTFLAHLSIKNMNLSNSTRQHTHYLLHQMIL